LLNIHASFINKQKKYLAILIVEELLCSSLNHLQQAPENSSTFGTSVHSTNFPFHLGNTPVTSLHTTEMPHMEHLGRSWLYMNVMQVFSHFIKRHANECIAELETGSDGSTWAKENPLSEALKRFFHLRKLDHQPGQPPL